MINIDPTPLFVLLPAVIALISVTRTLSDNQTRRRAIEARLADDTVRALFIRDPEVYAALKWGLVSCAVGIGIVLSHTLRFNFAQPVVYGLLLVCGGAALLLYYALALRAIERHGSDRNRAAPHFPGTEPEPDPLDAAPGDPYRR
ncbi:MAG TPA: DUF6249 domain-containing protein [Longimicrobium sp.]